MNEDNKNKLDKDYINLVNDILENGYTKEDRTGTGTVSVFGRQIRHKMSDGFPILTTKKMSLKNIVIELIWFLRGDTNIKYLVDNGCNIWNGDAYKAYATQQLKLLKAQQKEMRENGFDVTLEPNYLSKTEFIEQIKTDNEFAKKWGELGPVYGGQWRDWGGYVSDDHQQMSGETGVHIKGMDQVKTLFKDLLNNPDSRRLIVNSWNVKELQNMTLPPCHLMYQCWTRELNLEERKKLAIERLPILGTFITRGVSVEQWEQQFDLMRLPKRELSLMWTQRSADVGLGVPYNITSYAVLLELLARMVNMVPGELIGNFADTHIYSDHVEPIQEQLDREPMKLPRLIFSDWLINSLDDSHHHVCFDEWIESLQPRDFSLHGYESHSAINLPLSN